ncbi:MAG: hypothetical protein EXR67_07630 [Dehalococcoidia bacterium]|nr:hypothetical protein [Dehalococcoidia bacterium]
MDSQNRWAHFLSIAKHAHTATFLATALTIAVMHTPNGPSITFMRIPTHLQTASLSLNVPWPQSLTVYHWYLVSFMLLSILSAVGVRRLHRSFWQSFTKATSLANGVLLGTVVLFFVGELVSYRQLDATGVEAAAFYSVVFAAFAGVNLLTYVVARHEATTRANGPRVLRELLQ